MPEESLKNEQEAPMVSSGSVPELAPAPVPEPVAQAPVLAPVPESTQAPEPSTAHLPVNEPLAPEPEVRPDPLKPESEAPSQPKTSFVRDVFIKARNVIQFRKRKKLDHIMTLFLEKSQITNDEVEKFLHISDATAERYLNTLEKENKIKQVGKTGRSVLYSKI